MLRVTLLYFLSLKLLRSSLRCPYTFQRCPSAAQRSYFFNENRSTMSRAFVKEEDQEEAPFIPPRAALPPGATNYVTTAGRQQLLDERAALEAEKAGLALEDEAEQRKALAVVNGKLQLLAERISSAQVLSQPESPDEVRFGARVTLNVLGKGIKQQFQIVGVDEANVNHQKIAFVSPIARAITGKKVGEVAQLKLGNEVRALEVLEIAY